MPATRVSDVVELMITEAGHRSLLAMDGARPPVALRGKRGGPCTPSSWSIRPGDAFRWSPVDEQVVHRVPSWPVTTGQALSGPSRGICPSAASRLPPTSSTLPYRLNGTGETDLLFSRSQ